MIAYSAAKILKPSDLEAEISSLRANGRSIATLNGSFDLLHAGHLYILYEASLQADILIVALNSDASVRAYKNPKRPIITLEYRMEMMAALGFVNYVTWFDETDPRAILTRIQPDVHVNGEEYGQEPIEAETIRQGGGRLHIVRRIPGLATSEIIQKVIETCA